MRDERCQLAAFSSSTKRDRLARGDDELHPLVLVSCHRLPAVEPRIGPRIDRLHCRRQGCPYAFQMPGDLRAGGPMLTFEVIRRGSPDFVGLRDIFSGPLSDEPVIAMLCFVVHRLGDSRKSAREVGASRLSCFNTGFSGSPNGLSYRRAVAAQFLCISRLSYSAWKRHLGDSFALSCNAVRNF